MMLQDLDHSGARNLLVNCMELASNTKVLLVCEDPALGWYDREAAEFLTNALTKMGCRVSTIRVDGPDMPLPSNYSMALEEHDAVIYLARVGDQDRFMDKLPGKSVAMLYVRDLTALTSSYAAADHNAMKDLKAAVDAATFSASRVTITCPLGTSLECEVDREDLQSRGDVAVKRFPLCVPQPVPASGTSGKVALARWLTPTGSRSYTPASLKIDDVVFAQVKRGRIEGFEGEKTVVASIEKHYWHVADQFGIDRNAIHSWHAGIHPACSFDHKAEDDPDRWSNNIFGSPRFLHFHTCGAYPPGEICWMILDPTISLDGVPLWQAGVLKPENFERTADVLSKWPGLRPLFENPERMVGLAEAS